MLIKYVNLPQFCGHCTYIFSIFFFRTYLNKRICYYLSEFVILENERLNKKSKIKLRGRSVNHILSRRYRGQGSDKGVSTTTCPRPGSN